MYTQGQKITWCKRLGVTFKEDLSLGLRSVADLVHQKFPLRYQGPLNFSYTTYIYCMRLQMSIFLHLYWEAATESTSHLCILST